MTARLSLFASVILTTLTICAKELTIEVHVPTPQNTYVYQDSIHITADHPDITVISFKTDSPVIAALDPALETQRKAYKDNPIFNVVVDSKDSMQSSLPGNLNVDYTLSNNMKPQHLTIPLFSGPAKSNPTIPHSETKKETTSAPEQAQIPAAKPLSPFGRAQAKIGELSATIKTKISALATQSQSWWLRIIFIFLLGVLMSLTPCIYPMIPITIGILQAPGANKTLWASFIRALSYTFGMALTFALLGLLVATGSTHLGVLMSSPLFVLTIVILLGYLALSMFDFYPLYIPRFMQPKGNSATGSIASAFIFGAASGTMASPCLSPGLALVLAMVATIGNMFQGFLLLFIFGVGSSMPLLIIGTFSSSLNLLPQAGSWMNEIKKIFGLLLLGLCFYYLKSIVPTTLLLLALALFLMGFAMYYALSFKKYDTKTVKWIKSLMIIGLSAGSVFTCITLLKRQFVTAADNHDIIWTSNYIEAIAQAQQTGKKVLFDFGASWCTLCTQVENKVLDNTDVIAVLKQLIPAKVDCTNPALESCSKLLKQFDIKGFPALVLYNAKEDKMEKKWGSEVLDVAPQVFAQELTLYTKAD